MNRQVLRSACSRTRSELQPSNHVARSYFRPFSTTQSLATDDNASTPSRPSVRERGRQSAAEISGLARGGGRGRGRTFSPAHTATGTRAADGASPGPRKIIDVRSLPQGFRPGGASRGRGGARGGPGGLRGRGAARGGRGGRGGARGGRQAGGGEGNTEGQQQPKDDKMSFNWTADELAFDRALSFGERIPYIPKLDIESLRSFMPAVPSGSTDNHAVVVDNLNVLGTADPVGAPQGFQGSLFAKDLDRAGVRFFADAKDKDRAEEFMQEKRALDRAAAATEAGEREASGEQTAQEQNQEQNQEQSAEPIISNAEESVRQVILERAVAGRHESPKFAEDPAGMARARHLRAGTYTQRDVNIFENKLNSLLANMKPAKKDKTPAKGKAKAAAPKS